MCNGGLKRLRISEEGAFTEMGPTADNRIQPIRKFPPVDEDGEPRITPNYNHTNNILNECAMLREARSSRKKQHRSGEINRRDSGGSTSSTGSRSDT